MRSDCIMDSNLTPNCDVFLNCCSSINLQRSAGSSEAGMKKSYRAMTESCLSTCGLMLEENAPAACT